MRLEEFFPENKPKPKKRRRKTPKKDLEGSVQKDCLLWLIACPDVLYVERRNTGAVAFEGGGYVKFGKKGAADIWCLFAATGCSVGGHRVASVNHVEIECKRRDGKGVHKDNQKKFEKEMIAIGVPYLLVTSAEDMAEQLQKLGLTNWTMPGTI